jgi:hypothetical protein
MTRMLLSKNFCTVDCPIPPAAPVISAVFIVGVSLWLGGYLLRWVFRKLTESSR